VKKRRKFKIKFTSALLLVGYALAVNITSSAQQPPVTRAKVTTRPAARPAVAQTDQFSPTGESGALPSWRFAWNYKTEDFQTDEVKSGQFLKDYLSHEAEFFAKARHPESGLTYDGWNLDSKTGEPVEARKFSAASKECLDLGMCVKALYGDPIISQVVSPDAPEKAPEVAADILAKKLRSYNKYRENFPGFAGNVTWFHSGEEMRPTEGWKQAVPTLDMGEMAWSLLLCEKALKDTGREELAQGYKEYNTNLQEKAFDFLYEPKSGGVRGHVHISDPKDPNAKFSGDGIMTGEHGVHEGQMVVLYATLFAGLDEAARDKIWDGISMERVEHRYGTTWEGYWGSPHEEWAHLFLPYGEVDGFKNLFRIREKIRSQNAAERNYPGFAASAHHPKEDKYMSAAGVEGINSQPLEYQNTYTPYGAFPMLLQFAGELTGNVGLAWLHNMLVGPKLQGPMGAGESGDNLGTGAAHVKTIDVSFTNLLALSGGLQQETKELLQEKGLYEQFHQRMTSEYEETFGNAPLREPVGFAYPKAPAPVGSREYDW